MWPVACLAALPGATRHRDRDRHPAIIIFAARHKLDSPVEIQDLAAIRFHEDVDVFFSSQGLASNAYGLEVKAPTGHKSITFAESSDSIDFSK